METILPGMHIPLSKSLKRESPPRQQDQFKVKLERSGLRSLYISLPPMSTLYPQFPIGLMEIVATAFHTQLYIYIHSLSQIYQDRKSFEFKY